MPAAPLPPALLAEFRAIVGDANVLTDADRRAPYETDWTRRFHGNAPAVVRPADTAQVAAILALCSREGVAVVPQGGNTGLVGGAVPHAGEVVLSLARLRDLEPVDEAASQVVAGAGVTLEALHEHALGAGLAFGVDMGSRGSATIGGMVATNAGGIHVLRHGPMRAQIAGLEAVLADGSVLSRMSGVTKDTAGYDLPALIAGSEGTLAVVTRARLRLVAHPPHAAVALLALDGVASAVAIVAAVRRALPSLQAAELFLAGGLALVREHAGLPAPFARPAPAYLLLEAASATDPGAELAAALVDPAGDVTDSALATDPAGRARLWAYRERHTEAINAAGVPHKLDVSLPLARVAAFVDELHVLLADEAPAARPVLFGHLAEGNLHVNLLGLDPDDEHADAIVLGLVAEFDGSISSEHGVGAAKARYLPFTRSAAEIRAMRAIKAALDPAGILNPGVVFPPTDA